MDSELDELKKKRMNQLKQAEAEMAQQIEEIEGAVKAHLTKEALQRYGTLKLAHPETATQLMIAVAQALESGRLKGMLTEEQIVSVLKQLSRLQGSKQTRIIRK